MRWVEIYSKVLTKDQKNIYPRKTIHEKSNGCVFTTTNNYEIIRVTPRFWSFIKKKMYIDTGFGLYEVIKYIDNNFYICKFIKYSYFLDLYYKNIIKNSLEETCDILELFN